MLRTVQKHEMERLKNNSMKPNQLLDSQVPSLSIFENTEAVIVPNTSKKLQRSKSVKTFIPFVRERDGLNRIIGVNYNERKFSLILKARRSIEL